MLDETEKIMVDRTCFAKEAKNYIRRFESATCFYRAAWLIWLKTYTIPIAQIFAWSAFKLAVIS